LEIASLFGLILTLDLTLGLDQSHVKIGLDFGLRPKSSQDFSLRLKSYQNLTLTHCDLVDKVDLMFYLFFTTLCRSMKVEEMRKTRGMVKAKRDFQMETHMKACMTVALAVEWEHIGKQLSLEVCLLL